MCYKLHVVSLVYVLSHQDNLQQLSIPGLCVKNNELQYDIDLHMQGTLYALTKSSQ